MADGSWIRDDAEKVELYADHLQRVFTTHNMPSPPLTELESRPSCLFSFSPKAVASVLDRTNVRKAADADQVTNKMLRELPRTGIL